MDPVFSRNALINPQLWNRYSYGLNSPLSLVDPSGLDPEEPEAGRPIAADYGVSGFNAAEFEAWAAYYVYLNENIVPFLELQRRWAREAAAKEAARDANEEAEVAAAIDRVSGLKEALGSRVWTAAQGFEPGTFNGVAERGAIESVLRANEWFVERSARGSHKARLGSDAREFQGASDFFRLGSGTWSTLHVSVSPRGQYEVHIDRYNPDEGLAPMLVHVLGEWLLPRLVGR